MMKFELVSPERLLAATEVEAVSIPALEGDMTAMPNHAPFLSSLRPGFVSTQGGEAGRYFVTGGLVEVSADAVAVLAEEAVPADEVSADWLAEKIAAAEKAVEDAGEDRKQLEAQRLADFRFAADHLV